MISRLAIMMGGRVAEELKYGKDNITAGASSDIEQATKLARAMVTRWGFSDALGKVTYGENQEDPYQGGGQRQPVSEETARVIDAEIRRLTDEAYKTAKQIITSKKKQWTALAEGLLEYETLTGAEIQEVIAGKAPSRDMGSDSATPHVSSVPKTGRSSSKTRTSSKLADNVKVAKTDNDITKVEDTGDKSETKTVKASPKVKKSTTKITKSENDESDGDSKKGA